MRTTDNKIPNITMTVIFEGSALNRNEKIGGNILSVKKVHVNGEECVFISKVALRHYLFNTLKTAFSWKETEIAQGKEVIQFNVLDENIFTSQELDAFGYMFTDEKTLTRKSPVGITKAISLKPYEQDLALYSNHDLVRRSREQGNNRNPNLFTKEEFSGFFKFSITIDSEKIGKDFFIVDNYDDSNNNLTLELVKPETVVFDKVEEVESEDQKVFKYLDQSIFIEGKSITIPAKLLKIGKNDISIKTTPDLTFSNIEENDNKYKLVFEKIEKNKKNIIEKVIISDNQEISFKNITEINKISFGAGKNKKDFQINIDETNNIIQIPKELFNENPDRTISLNKEILKPNSFFKTELSDEEVEAINKEEPYRFLLNEEPIYDSVTKKLIVKKGLSININYKNKNNISTFNNYCENAFDYITEEGNCIHIEKIKGKNKYQIYLILSVKKKAERILQIIEAIKDGIISQSSGELNSFTPLFMLLGAVKVPTPIFHSFIEVEKLENGKYETIGINDSLENSWLIDTFFIKDSDKIRSQSFNISKINAIRKNNNYTELKTENTWIDFIKSVNLLTNDENSSN